MQSKKYTIKSDSKVDVLIIALLNGQYDKNGSEAQILAQADHLQFYFTDLHLHITSENIILARKYEILPDGLYVLLKGQVSFKQFNSSFENEKEVSRAKGMNRNSSGMNYLSQTFSVFQSNMKNSAAVQDSYLLHILQNQKFQTGFDQKFNQRKNLCQNYYLSHYHQILKSSLESLGLITVDFKLHSNFVYKTFAFRQTLNLKDISIIKEGRVKFTVQSGYTVELQRYAILLPQVCYEVTSASLQILTIYGNQDLNIKVNTDTYPTKQTKNCWFPSVNKASLLTKSDYNQQASSSYKFQKPQTRKERLKRQKQVTKLSKQSQSYSIISSFLCKKSLDFAKNQIFNNKANTPSHKNHKTPLVLFSFGNQKSYPFNLKPKQTTSSVFQQLRNSLNQNQKYTEKNQSDKRQNILKKLKLPVAEYQKVLKKPTLAKTCMKLRTQNKTKSLFTLTRAKQPSEAKENRYLDEQAFVKYEDS